MSNQERTMSMNSTVLVKEGMPKSFFQERAKMEFATVDANELTQPRSSEINALL